MAGSYSIASSFFLWLTRILNAPAVGIVDIDAVKSDTTLLDPPIRGFMVTGAGNVSVLMVDGTSGVLPSCQPGIQYGGCISRVNSSLTVATGIVGLY